MPTFSIKQMLFATTLMCFGCGFIWATLHPPAFLRSGDELAGLVSAWFGWCKWYWGLG